MKIVKCIGILLAFLGLVLYLPPVTNSVAMFFGEPIGRFAGMVSFTAGWAVLGASLAFSAGFKYQFTRIRKRRG